MHILTYSKIEVCPFMCDVCNMVFICMFETEIYRIYSNKRPGGVKFSRRGALIRVKFIGNEIYLNTSITSTEAYADTVSKIVSQNM